MGFRNLGKWMAVMSAVIVMSAAAVMNVWAVEKLDKVTELYWNEDDDNDDKRTEAIWEEIEDAYEYEVALYREGKRVKTVPTKKTKYNFKKYMVEEGDYTFKVRAMAKAKSKKFSNSSWSSESEPIYISEGRAEYNKEGKKKDTSKEGPGVSNGGGTSSGMNSASNHPSANPSSAVIPQGWLKDSTGWWYRRSDGTFPVNEWFQDPADGRYYMFDGQGYMRTGWISWEGRYYYCDPEGSPSGAMATGDVVIGQKLYHFDDSGAVSQDAVLPEGVVSAGS